MDRYRLEYVMKTKGITESQLCERIGISRSAFYRKKCGKTEFTLSDIKKIMEALDLQSANDIFFANEVS